MHSELLQASAPVVYYRRTGRLLAVQVRRVAWDANSEALARVRDADSYTAISEAYVALEGIALIAGATADGEIPDPLDPVLDDAIAGRSRRSPRCSRSRRWSRIRSAGRHPRRRRPVRSRPRLPPCECCTPGPTAVDEAYDALGVCYEFFAEQLGWLGYDGANGELRFVVHFGERWSNLYWDGTQIVAGDGDEVVFTRFTRSLDLIAHDYAFAAIRRFAPLDHRNQSGAVLQSASDVFGALVEQYRQGQKAIDATWLIGENTMVRHPGVRGLRFLLEPGTAFDDPALGRDPQVAHLSRLLRSPEDNGSVHANSGVGNRAFARAAISLGGYAWQTLGPVWWQALHDLKLTARSGYRSFAAATLRAAGDALADVARAWQDVGVPVAS